MDKSIPYKSIIMKLDNKKLPQISCPALPPGYSFRLYQEGDEIHWARIETSVLEFSTETDAYDYFVKNFMPFRADLQSRCVFVTNQDGLPIATATAWYGDTGRGRQAALHWVAVCPAYQGLGIGKAVVQRALCIFQETEKNKDVFLHTQTWSHTAVNMYHRLGFVLIKEAGIMGFDNDYSEAVTILEDVLQPEVYRSLIDTAN